MKLQQTDIWSLVGESFYKQPDHLAWICRQNRKESAEFCYGEIRDYALTTASKLREQGVGRGDIVGVMAPNGPHWTVAALAVWKVGGIVAPIHIGNSDHEIEQQIKAVEPKKILVDGVKNPPNPSTAIDLAADSERVEAERQQSIPQEPDSEAVRIYTSGSTGVPKMVRLSHGNITSNVLAGSTMATLEPSDRFLSLLPFSHAMGLTGVLLLPMYAGATMVLPKVLAANEILAAMAEEKITIIIAVPRLFRNIMIGLEKRFTEGGKAMEFYRQFLKILPLSLRRLVNFPIRRHFGGPLKCWMSGGSRLDPEITRFFHEIGIPLRQGYGLTETSPVVAVQEDFDRVLDSVGKPVEHVEVKIHEPNEEGSGELWVKGPNVMLGYVDEDQTREVMEDGWFKTGDIARTDADGNITLTGRSKRLIVTEAGKNVYPEELETLLERDPTVKEAAVIEVDMRPAAIVAMEGDDPADGAKNVLKAFNKLVSKHNQITRFALVDELPRTPLGKIALSVLGDVFAKNEVA